MKSWSVFVTLCLATGMPAAERPHVVIFLADDLSRRDCGPHGGQEVPTPAMQSLAREGMTFQNAFVASPSCAPSRAALLTGLDPIRNGAMLNHASPRAAIKKWPAYFQELGYEVAAIGKVAHYAQVTQYGFDHVSHYQYHNDECIAAATRWLEQRRSPKPLCLFVGTNWPHVPWPRESAIPVRGLPPTLANTPETLAARSRYLAAVALCDRDLGLIRQASLKYLGPNHLFLFSSDNGAQFPFGKWNLTDEGVRMPLIVAWPGQVAPASTTDALVSWTDLLPTVLTACGGSPPPNLSGSSFLDVLKGAQSTHRDRIFLTHSADGTMNRYPMRAVRTSSWKYIRNLDPAAEHHTHIDRGALGTDGRSYWDSWITRADGDPATARLIRRYHQRPAEELYNLELDPWELINLADNAAQAARLRDLRADLDQWMRAGHDQGLSTERELLQNLDRAKSKAKAKN